jgi:chromosome segregation ATPase
VIQSILFFALGFLTAGFLALLVAPAFWRRAVTLTRKRVEAAMPMTLDEIQADKDRMRAEFAMSARRLEMSAQALREKNAAQIVEIGRGHEEIKALNSVISEKNREITALEAAGEALRTELQQQSNDMQRLSARLAEADNVLKQRAAEIEKLGRLYEDASFSSSSRQIELVARESELEQLDSEAVQLRSKAEKAERLFQEREREAATLRDALRAEARKVDGLERTLAEREEKLEHSGKELARLSEELARATAAENEEIEQPAGRKRLESRLTALTRENRKLKADLKAAATATAKGGDDEMLRERMGELAAQMVHLTSVLEGQGSPIAKALSSPMPNSGQGAGAEKISLADRVRALQKIASAK